MSATKDILGRGGLGIFMIQAEHLDKVKVHGDYIKQFKAGERAELDFEGFTLPESLKNVVFDKDTLLVAHHNAYVTTGLQNSLNREFGLGGNPVGYIGVSNNNTAVTAATVYLNGASGGAAANTIILAISPTATLSSTTVTAGATFTNASFTSGVFAINKVGLLTTATDAGTGLVDVIGGSGGSAPYNKTFGLDLTSAGNFSLVLQIAVTASAV